MMRHKRGVTDQLVELRKMVGDLRTGLNRVSAQVDLIGQQTEAVIEEVAPQETDPKEPA